MYIVHLIKIKIITDFNKMKPILE